ncbi:hypothetical protein JW960_10580 [candidate division KSB1 bacterium]|nr:hypothetical protein [candidate division KSB1 bacterium]
MTIEILPVECTRDNRGERYTAPKELWKFVGVVDELHMVTLETGTIRGNHFHSHSKEAVIVEADGEWELAWQLTGNASPECRIIDAGVYMICFPAGVAHAFRNTSSRPLRLNCYMDVALDMNQPDVQRCQLL